MPTGIPDEFLSGSKMLDEERELLALGLMKLAFIIASQYTDDKNFGEIIGLKQKGFLFFKKSIDKKRENRIFIELIMINLFIISRWLMNNNESDPSEILDRMYFHFRKAISDNDLDFAKVVEERYLVYSESLKNQSGAEPAWWFGKAATQFVTNKEIDERIGLQSILLFAQLIGSVNDSVKSFVESGDYKKGF